MQVRSSALESGAVNEVQGKGKSSPDPLNYLNRVLMKLSTAWQRFTYPFSRFGSGVSIHYFAEIARHMAPYIALGDSVFIGKDVWLNVVDNETRSGPAIILENGCSIGRNAVISAKNQILLEENVLLGPSVLIMDHNHEYTNPDLPILAQGTTPGGTITIGSNSWLGFGCAIVCDKGDLVLGRNTIVGANSVVTRSFPPFSIVAGVPAKLIKRLDDSGNWVRVSEEESE